MWTLKIRQPYASAVIFGCKKYLIPNHGMFDKGAPGDLSHVRGTVGVVAYTPNDCEIINPNPVWKRTADFYADWPKESDFPLFLHNGMLGTIDVLGCIPLREFSNGGRYDWSEVVNGSETEYAGAYVYALSSPVMWNCSRTPWGESHRFDCTSCDFESACRSKSKKRR